MRYIILMWCAFLLQHLSLFGRPVKILVIDADSRVPISGAMISASLDAVNSIGDIKWASKISVTDRNGVAVIEVPLTGKETARHDALRPVTYSLTINNKAYKAELMLCSSLPEDISKRSPTEIPKVPDEVISVRSIETEKRDAEEEDLARILNQQEASRLVRKQPAYWPDAKSTEEVDRLVVRMRWRLTTRGEPGDKQSLDKIRELVIRHMGRKNPVVSEIAFVDRDTAMVKASWYSSPIAAGGYTYVLKRKSGKWKIIRCYHDWVS